MNSQTRDEKPSSSFYPNDTMAYVGYARQILRPKKVNHPLTTVLESARSSWIQAVTYLPLAGARGKGFLLIFTKMFDTETVIVYVDVPFWLKGLLLAGYRGSIGRAYHRLVKGKYQSQTYTSPGNVADLKKMFGLVKES